MICLRLSKLVVIFMDIDCKYKSNISGVFFPPFAQIVNITVDSSIYFKCVKVKIFSDCTHFRFEKSFNNIGLFFFLILFFI